jgi:hypothetical protein
VVVSPIEVRSVPGPKARALRAKTIRRGSFSGSGGQAILFPPMLFPRNALASGPQVYFFAEKAIAKAKGGKQGIKKFPVI